MITIREASEADLDEVLRVEREAFGRDEEAALVRDLLSDSSAAPFLSLLALKEEKAVGHALFTHARLEPKANLLVGIMAPVAVVPDYQKQGIGSQLVEFGLDTLCERQMDFVFVLGYPEYYQRFGFRPAKKIGFSAPFPIADKHADAWMAIELTSKNNRNYQNTVICADTLNKSMYWQE